MAGRKYSKRRVIETARRSAQFTADAIVALRELSNNIPTYGCEVEEWIIDRPNGEIVFAEERPRREWIHALAAKRASMWSPIAHEIAYLVVSSDAALVSDMLTDETDTRKLIEQEVGILLDDMASDVEQYSTRSPGDTPPAYR